MSPIEIDYPSTHVCRVRINRPKKLNAVNYDVRQAMLTALPDILNDPNVRALVLGGVGGNLSAGGDVPSMKDLSRQDAQDRMEHIHKLCRLIANAPLSIVTAAEGVSAGGAVGLALLGDFIVVDDTTKIMVPFLKLGLAPDWGMMRSLPQRVGIARARQIILETQTLSGERCLEIGLADYFAEDESAMDLAIKKAERLSRQPSGAVAMVKERLRTLRDLDDDLSLEAEHQVGALTGPEFKEGFAAYTEKRRADFLK